MVGTAHPTGLPAWVLFAPFYAIVSLHYQIPIYLYYSSALTLVALVSFTAEVFPPWWGRAAAVGGTVLMTGVALTSYAARPVTESWDALVRGDAPAALVRSDLPRCSLWIPEADRAKYAELLRIIDADTRPDGAILAIPSHAELYFLSGRRNPERFYNSALGLRTRDDLDAALQRLTDDPPRIIVFAPDDKYATPLSKELLTSVWWHYQELTTIDGLDVYRAWLDPPRLSR